MVILKNRVFIKRIIIIIKIRLWNSVMNNVNIVLVEPEIPQNTGNIARTCAATGVKLHLVEPLGFSISDKHLKRAGLDYWNDVEIEKHESLKAFLNKYGEQQLFFATTKAKKNYAQIQYPDNCFILFGKETKGLPEELLSLNYNNCIRIPMKGSIRSLNLSNSVAVILYEVLRQGDFSELEERGELKFIK